MTETKGNYRTTIIFAPAHCLKESGHWSWAFYDFVRQSKGARMSGQKYRFESDLSVLTPEDRVIFTGLTRGCESWITENGDQATIIVLPGTAAEEVEKYQDALRHARVVIRFGDEIPCSDLPNLVTYPKARAVSPARLESKRPSPSEPIADAHVTEGMVWLAPASYLTIWEYLISKRLIPQHLSVVERAQNSVPGWLTAALEPYGVHMEVLPLTADTLVDIRRAGTPVVRDAQTGARTGESGGDYVDVLAARAGLFPMRVSADGRQDTAPPFGPKEIASVADLLGTKVRRAEKNPEAPEPVSAAPPKINIVCYNPTYLFADLTQRFVDAGCVHSDFPLPDADAYIWMRPQEYIAVQDFLNGTPMIDVPESYKKLLRNNTHLKTALNRQSIAEKSTAIHHGICPDPIYQFDPVRNVHYLSQVNAVVGVCPFESCYRHYTERANPHNFTFSPIGYDHTVFQPKFVRQETRKAGSKLNVGFVGRAYGTTDADLLARTRTATPRGYIKGGDHLLNIALRLKAKDIDVHLHIIGSNWETHVKEMEKYGIELTYYRRDKDISYTDYPSVFAGFDCLLVTTRGESGPVPVIEAMSVGVPVIGCDNAGMVKYAAGLGPHNKTFTYDTKWHVMDVTGHIPPPGLRRTPAWPGGPGVRRHGARRR